jgi:asparaginyl-tRNA synthetase
MSISRISQFLQNPAGTSGKVMGWVRSVRKQKTHCFIDLDDGSRNIQVLASADKVNSIITGCSIEVSGTLTQGPKELEIHSEDIKILGESDGVKAI